MFDHIATLPPMFRLLPCRPRFLLGAAACAALAACGSIDGMSSRMVSSITPYRVEIVQGNFVSREQVEALRPGMSRQQVREVLGTPLMTSLFHSDRWDYVFTLKRQGIEPQARRLAVFFKGSVMERFEGDPMPSEAEFVATLDKKARPGKSLPLEATDASLGKFAVPAPAGAATPAAETPPPPANYPPLEAPAR